MLRVREQFHQVSTAFQVFRIDRQSAVYQLMAVAFSHRVMNSVYLEVFLHRPRTAGPGDNVKLGLLDAGGIDVEIEAAGLQLTGARPEMIREVMRAQHKHLGVGTLFDFKINCGRSEVDKAVGYLKPDGRSHRHSRLLGQ